MRLGFFLATAPGDVGVLPDAHVTEHVGRALGHQHLDLVHGAAELQVAQVQARGEPVAAAPLVRQDVLPGTESRGTKGTVQFNFLFNFICISLTLHYSLKGLNRPNISDIYELHQDLCCRRFTKYGDREK